MGRHEAWLLEGCKWLSQDLKGEELWLTVYRGEGAWGLENSGEGKESSTNQSSGDYSLDLFQKKIETTERMASKE